MSLSLKNIMIISLMVITFVSCSSDDTTTPINELQGLLKVQEIQNATHTAELYTATGKLVQGYNDITIRLKNRITNTYETNAAISWSPIMYMMNMQHSCPASGIEKVTTASTLYKGFIIFQMASNDSEYWQLNLAYSIQGQDYNLTDTLVIQPSAKRIVTTFTGADDSRYVMAWVAPQLPKVALNDYAVAVYKMENMMQFVPVNGYTVKIDPRMPSMGNHSSPNNVHASQNNVNGFYWGKLALTMTGYWKINLQLINTEGSVVKGEPITTEVPESSLFFEIEF